MHRVTYVSKKTGQRVKADTVGRFERFKLGLGLMLTGK